jgi:hypothetical protein
MNLSVVLAKVDHNTREWANTLSSDDLASILSAVYRLPHLITAIKSPTRIESDLPVEAGKRGESKFDDLCKELPSNYNVINTAKLGHAGDFIIEFSLDKRVYRCLVDIKNYKGTVPKKELEKFDYDIQYGQYDGGLMISYGSKFSGIPDNIFIDQRVLPNGITPVMYLAEIPDNFIPICVQVICTKLSVDVQRRSSLDKLESSLQFINNSLTQSSTTRRLLADLNITVSTQIQKMQEHLIGSEVQIKQAVRTIEKELRANHQPIKLETHNWVSDLPTIPSVTKRSDNIADVPILTTAHDFPPPIEKQESPVEFDIILDKYCDKDINLVLQITEMIWDDVLQEEDGTSVDFVGVGLKFELVPKRTLTKIRIKLEDASNTHPEILAVLKKSKSFYIGTLNQTIINAIQKYYGTDNID